LLQSEPDAAAVAEARRGCEIEQAAGDPVAGYQLALLDLGPDGWNPERATPLIRQAADAGVPEAQYWMAWQLEQGPLLDNDPIAARRWYEAAAEQSHRLALVRLADAYELGQLGVPVEPRRAAELRALAAQCEADSN
jgi:TPR repeat protein